jgi:hypothetical protein
LHIDFWLSFWGALVVRLFGFLSAGSGRAASRTRDGLERKRRPERAIRLSLATHDHALKCWKQRALVLDNVDAHRSFTAGMCTPCVPAKNPGGRWRWRLPRVMHDLVTTSTMVCPVSARWVAQASWARRCAGPSEWRHRGPASRPSRSRSGCRARSVQAGRGCEPR